MNTRLHIFLVLTALLGLTVANSLQAQNNHPPGPSDRAQDPGPQTQPFDGPPGFNGPPPGEPAFDGPGPFGPGRGGFGPMGGVQEDLKVVKQFDRDGNKWLNTEERKAAREFLNQQGRRGGRMRGPGGPGFGRRGDQGPAEPGQKLSPADVKSFAGQSLYDEKILRTLFLEFENADWERELEAFHSTDVDVPARLIVDGKTYQDVGVHFRGASSYMGIATTRKRSLNLAVDLAHDNQALEGYRTLNLLNAHEDPSFLRAVLYLHISQQYIPAPKANFVRVVINGESWGIYANAQQFNKDFTRDWFKSTQGARWKAPGSPGGRASLAYLGDDPAPYKRLYDIRSKDTPDSWASLVQLCKTLNETPNDQLEQALAPILDVEGALKFLALENTLINNDGYWIRSSDYNLYRDEKGRFHIIPHDANETFAMPGGPGGPGGFGGPGGPGGFGPGMILTDQALQQADTNGDDALTRDEFVNLAAAWFTRLDSDKTGKLSQEQFVERAGELFAPPGGPNAPRDGGPQDQLRPGPGGPGGFAAFGPGRFLGPGLFSASDINKDGTLTCAEFKETFGNWANQWDTQKAGKLGAEQLRAGFEQVLPRPNFAGPGGGGRRGRGGPGDGGMGGPPGFGGGPRTEGVKLDPLVAASDPSKPLISKLLAVPALRTRYLGYVRDIAETWLDWNHLGPLATQLHQLIAADVKADTHKLSTNDQFKRSLTGGTAEANPFAGRTSSLKDFADQRRAYLLNLSTVQSAPRPTR